MPGVGEAAARAILAHFAQAENVTMVENLLASGVRPTLGAEVVVTAPVPSKQSCGG